MTLHILQASPATASIQVNTSSGVELSAQRSGAGRAGEAPPDRAPNELTRWWRKRDSKRRSLSQNTSVCFRGRVWPKGRPEWLEPSHHLSGTDISNRSSSSRESAGNSGNRATQMALVRYYSPMGESWQATAYRKGLTGIIPGCFTVFYNVKRA